jgi:hypothetical protein
MSKHKKRSGSLKRLKAIQENLMADSAAAVAGMAGEKPDESADFELAGRHCRSVLCGQAAS